MELQKRYSKLKSEECNFVVLCSFEGAVSEIASSIEPTPSPEAKMRPQRKSN